MNTKSTRTAGLLVLQGITFCSFATSLRADGYPEASRDQATIDTIESLKIERYAGLDEEGMQAEYQWTLDMARVCLDNPRSVLDRRGRVTFAATEFQRHAGRTARYRGFLERALEDYETAIEYSYEHARMLGDSKYEAVARDWVEVTIARDLADTCMMIGADEVAADISNVLIDRTKAYGKASDLAEDLDRLAQIAERQGQFAECVSLQREAVEGRQGQGAKYLEEYPELAHVDRTQPWDILVRHYDVRRALARGQSALNDLREVYYQLARALRLNRQLDEAAYALETAALTAWQTVGTYRQNLDFYVDREWAFLALDRGEAGEAVRRGNVCLSKYAASIHPSERIELIDLVSRGLEQTGDLQGALGRLTEAIAIVEDRRANLFEDEHKQLYVAGYAPLYRRALGLVIRINAGRGAEAINESFEWSERVKARAMFDTLNRYDRRMARAVSVGDTGAMRSVRDLAGEVVSIDQIRNAPWWPADAALLEFAYGDTKGPDAGTKGTRDRSLSKPSRDRKGADREKTTRPTDATETIAVRSAGGAASEDRFRAVYLWVVRPQGATFHRLDAGADQVDENCAALAEALGHYDRRDQSWVRPASWLYEHTIAPVMSDLRGVQRLIIVGAGKLRTIPFETLVMSAGAFPKRPMKHRLLLEDFAISYAPSATLLAAISRDPQRTKWGDSLWAFASTKFRGAAPDESGGSGGKPDSPTRDYKLVMRAARSLSLDDLPLAKREVTEVALGFDSHRVTVFIDQPNMKSKLTRAARDGTLQSTRFLHFATHAIVDPARPYLTGLVLSPPYPTGERQSRTHGAEGDQGGSTKAGRRDGSTEGRWEEGGGEGPGGEGRRQPWPAAVASATRRSMDAGRPELLTVGELARLDLGSELVVLSACHTLGDDPIDGDWINGLTRAFLVAGCSGVVCSTWDAPDRATMSIMPAMYRALRRTENGPGRGIDVPRALQTMKCSFFDSPMFAHPSVWSPWVYYGWVRPGES